MRWLTCAMLPVALAATLPLVSTPNNEFVATSATVGTESESDMDDLTPIPGIADIRILEHGIHPPYPGGRPGTSNRTVEECGERDGEDQFTDHPTQMPSQLMLSSRSTVCRMS